MERDGRGRRPLRTIYEAKHAGYAEREKQRRQSGGGCGGGGCKLASGPITRCDRWPIRHISAPPVHLHPSTNPPPTIPSLVNPPSKSLTGGLIFSRASYNPSIVFGGLKASSPSFSPSELLRSAADISEYSSYAVQLLLNLQPSRH